MFYLNAQQIQINDLESFIQYNFEKEIWILCTKIQIFHFLNASF